jgi:hypothetical protein
MAIWEKYHSNYRLVILVMVLKTLTPPLAMAAFICKIASWTRLSYSVLTYLLAIPPYCTIRVQYDVYAKQRDAARKGAILVPEIKGKWIGNIDIVFL